MKLSATPSVSSAEGKARRTPLGASTIILVLIAVVVVATGVGVAGHLSGPASYACMSISHDGNQVKVTTSGMIHYVKAQYYISCNEGSPLPTGEYKASCLTVTSQTFTSSVGSGASTQYYYLSGGANGISIQGAPAPANGTEIINPANVSLTATC